MSLNKNISVASRGLLLCLCLIESLLCGCVRTTIPLTNISVPVPDVAFDMSPILEIFGSYKAGYFQNRSWPDAFHAMHQKLSREYPFTEWKAVDWEKLYDRYAPRVAAAEADNNDYAYYLAVREYLYSIPDGYLRITTPSEYREAAIGGDFGFSILPLADGNFVAAHIEEDSYAARAGIKWGATILEWDGKPIADAVAQTSVLWSESPSATTEYKLYEQCMMLTRAPVGTEVSVMFKNVGAQSAWITRLQARRDRFTGLADLTKQDKPFSEFESPFETKMLADNIGYIKIYFHAPTVTTPFPTRAFRRIMERFVQENVAGIVLDLRGDIGGSDAVGLTFAGHFIKERLFMRDVVAFDAQKGGFALLENERAVVEPRSPHFSGPVAILIHRNTRDGGQMIADLLNRQENVFTVGVTGTEGSYAYLGADIHLPNGYVVSYPIGRMLDENGNIRIAGSADMTSRVVPDVQVPMTLENLDLFFRQEKDPVLEAATAEIHARIAQQ